MKGGQIYQQLEKNPEKVLMSAIIVVRKWFWMIQLILYHPALNAMGLSILHKSLNI